MAVNAPTRRTTMRAFTYEQYGSTEVLELREVEQPAVEDGEVLVRVRAAAVAPLDWHVLTGVPYIARAAVPNGICGRDVGQRRQDDLVTRLQVICQQREVDGHGPVRHRDRSA